MGREYRILRALKPCFSKVPTPIHYCKEESPIGSPFYIMEKVEGIIFRAGQAKAKASDWEKLADSLIRTLAQLHQVLDQHRELEKLGKAEDYIHRQVDGWTQRYTRAATDDISEMNLLAAWLRENIPTDHRAALIHNDFKYDNLVFDQSGKGEIQAVLDWEMATIGHPLMDLGTTLAYWAEHSDPEILKQFNPSWKAGNPNRKELIARYFHYTGQTPENVLFYYLFGLFKIAVIGQQIYKRFLSGHSADKRFEMLIHVVRACASRGVQALEDQQI